ncbi:carboxypeptidase-like regulatory domain-containing protein [Gillisia hiemivivida]|uniref:Carboxypeptidase-like regulatory domain-containing protein n=1 Tax=Gillisia hiemivivida TaxID=291190 RepID=A0A5C6ZW72_9FLAO|nr:carboxypeptidase-like regulatory domain-containing protein [Gillisia hiemivivida]TXD95167.1 carboxypeptidase-like regulatory domain-containing protein [Gillisia hiemivivida]
MKTNFNDFQLSPITYILLLALICLTPRATYSYSFQQSIETNKFQYVEFKGEVVDNRSGDPIISAHLTVNGSNISTITNSEGEFSLKIPADLMSSQVTISFLGYKSKTVPLSSFSKEYTRITLEESLEVLSEVSIFKATDAKKLIRAMLEKRGDNYFDNPTLMTAFYREIIKKGRRNASLSEAVVKIYKQPNSSAKKDDVAIYKARKSTDYDRLDTLAIKLRGGPFNTLYVDLMKYTEFVFDAGNLEEFRFSFDQPTKMGKRYVYVVDFEEINKSLPWYYGKLFIDTETNTLLKASYKLNVDDRDTASEMFVKRKPSRATVYPVDVNYEINYIESDGKWYYGYGNALLEFVVNWDRKLFNSRYTLNSEMVVTNWEDYTNKESRKDMNYIRPSVVMVDDISGFADANFWGNDNIIEPEKSIQNAIEKIQRQLNRE